MSINRIIHWFNQDLRLRDNPSLAAAAKQATVLPVYIFDDANNHTKPVGAASRCWLHHSLLELNTQLDNNLIVKAGDPLQILTLLIKRYQIDAVFWNHNYEPWQMKRDADIKTSLRFLGVAVRSYNASLLWEPREINNKAGGNYKVFTPFYRNGCLQAEPPRKPLPPSKSIKFLTHKEQRFNTDSLHLLPTISWDKKMMSHWKVGEAAANKQLKKFIQHGLSDYQNGRNFPAKQNVSRLSPHLHWGEISPNQIWHQINKLPKDDNTDCYLSEIGWREFSYNLLYYYPTLPNENLQKSFNRFPWRKNKKLLTAWQQGKTGYPIIDAGMRELWQTGFMHNRVRMITASFLVKNCLIHWHEGEKWFWDCLLDADLASNSASWQWVAGCGADAAPFFRIFNPVTQGKKFDPDGEYIRHYVPELANISDKLLHTPWEASNPQRQNYPNPIVNLTESRKAALAAYQATR